MIRALIGLIALPFVILGLISGIVCREVGRSRMALALTIALFVAACCSGCAGALVTALDHDARQCQSEAWTVDAMLKCQELYPQHETDAGDWISAPIGELERVIQHRGHDHD